MPNENIPARDEQIVEYIQLTGAVMEKAAALAAEKAAQDEKVQKLIPDAVKALLDNERIEPHQKEAAEKILTDPVKVLEVLIKTAAHRNDAERAKLGQPVAANGHAKKASADYNSLEDPYVGRRSRPGEAESDKAFKRGLGLM